MAINRTKKALTHILVFITASLGVLQPLSVHAQNYCLELDRARINEISNDQSISPFRGGGGDVPVNAKARVFNTVDDWISRDCRPHPFDKNFDVDASTLGVLPINELGARSKFCRKNGTDCNQIWPTSTLRYKDQKGFCVNGTCIAPLLPELDSFKIDNAVKQQNFYESKANFFYKGPLTGFFIKILNSNNKRQNCFGWRGNYGSTWGDVFRYHGSFENITTDRYCQVSTRPIQVDQRIGKTFLVNRNVPPPKVNKCTVDSTDIAGGDQIQLAWSTDGFGDPGLDVWPVEILRNGVRLLRSMSVNDTYTFAPESTATYVCRAWGPEGVKADSSPITVKVTPLPDVWLEVNDSSATEQVITAGDTVKIEWGGNVSTSGLEMKCLDLASNSESCSYSHIEADAKKSWSVSLSISHNTLITATGYPLSGYENAITAAEAEPVYIEVKRPESFIYKAVKGMEEGLKFYSSSPWDLKNALPQGAGFVADILNAIPAIGLLTKPSISKLVSDASFGLGLGVALGSLGTLAPIAAAIQPFVGLVGVGVSAAAGMINKLWKEKDTIDNRAIQNDIELIMGNGKAGFIVGMASNIVTSILTGLLGGSPCLSYLLSPISNWISQTIRGMIESTSRLIDSLPDASVRVSATVPENCGWKNQGCPPLGFGVCCDYVDKTIIPSIPIKASLKAAVNVYGLGYIDQNDETGYQVGQELGSQIAIHAGAPLTEAFINSNVVTATIGAGAKAIAGPIFGLVGDCDATKILSGPAPETVSTSGGPPGHGGEPPVIEAEYVQQETERVEIEKKDIPPIKDPSQPATVNGLWVAKGRSEKTTFGRASNTVQVLDNILNPTFLNRPPTKAESAKVLREMKKVTNDIKKNDPSGYQTVLNINKKYGGDFKSGMQPADKAALTSVLNNSKSRLGMPLDKNVVYYKRPSSPSKGRAR